MAYELGGYGPGNPHPFDDPNLQRGDPEYPADTYPGGPGVHDPTHYERWGAQGQRDYYAARQQELAYQLDYAARLRQQGGGSVPQSETPARTREPMPPGPFRVTVDYRMSPEQMILRGGYEVVPQTVYSESARRLITNQPPHPDVEEVDIHLVTLSKDTPNSMVGGALKRMGVKPANVPQLLALGAAYPDLQRRGPIAAVDGIANGGTSDLIYLSTYGDDYRSIVFWWQTRPGENVVKGTAWIAVVRDDAEPTHTISPVTAIARGRVADYQRTTPAVGRAQVTPRRQGPSGPGGPGGASHR